MSSTRRPTGASSRASDDGVTNGRVIEVVHYPHNMLLAYLLMGHRNTQPSLHDPWSCNRRGRVLKIRKT